MANMVSCLVCGEPVDVDAPMKFETVDGYREMRTGEIVAEEEIPLEERQYAHARCAARISRGISPIDSEL